jgi:hypothetical protein
VSTAAVPTPAAQPPGILYLSIEANLNAFTSSALRGCELPPSISVCFIPQTKSQFYTVLGKHQILSGLTTNTAEASLHRPISESLLVVTQ